MTRRITTESMDVSQLRIAAKQSQRTKLVDAFLRHWRAMKPESWPMPVQEHRFHPVRRWRFDLAFLEVKTAIEINGGTFMKRSRHSGGAGQHGDMDKLNHAQQMGWKVYQFDAAHLSNSQIADTIQFVIDAMLSEEAHG